MATLSPSVHFHPVSGETVFPVLKSTRPYSLPLLGRLNFHHRSPASHVLATFPPSASQPAQGRSESTPEASYGGMPKCFAVAFLDRTRRPETECWIFVSGEVPGRCPLSSTKQCDDCKAALLSLIDTIPKLDVPNSIHDVEVMTKSNPSLAPALSGEVLLFGQIHETCAKLIREAVTGVGAQPPVCGIDAPYIKYLFKPSTLPALRDLPEGLRWGEVRKQDFALVRSRTSIPRQDATLALLPSLAVFPEDQHGDVAPVAWAFLGVDGSLTSLHTEPEYRGKGLAKVLTGKLFREGGFRGKSLNGKLSAEKSEVFGSDEDWFHGDVALDNKSSRGVCEGLGGKTSWIVYWIRIDLTKAQNVTS